MKEQSNMAEEIVLYKRAARGATLFDGLLTGIAWVGFLALIAIGLYNIWAAETAPEAEHIEFFGHVMLSSLYTMLSYLSVALLLLISLVCWSRYNTWRWRGKERRTRFPNLDVGALPTYFGADTELVTQLRDAAIVTIHSDSNGDIHFLTHSKNDGDDHEVVLPAESL